VDGNKRVAHAAMEVFLILNAYEIVASVDEHERLMLDLAAGKMTREQLTEWRDGVSTESWELHPELSIMSQRSGSERV